MTPVERQKHYELWAEALRRAGVAVITPVGEIPAVIMFIPDLEQKPLEYVGVRRT